MQFKYLIVAILVQGSRNERGGRGGPAGPRARAWQRRRGLARTGVPRGQRPSDVCATEIADFECRIADGHWPLGERLFRLHRGGTSPLLLPGLHCLRVLRRLLLLQ